MSAVTFVLFCVQACLVQNALSTLIGPGVYGNGYGLGLSSGAGLTAAAAELGNWYGRGSPAKCGLADREIAADIAYTGALGREMVREYAAPMWAGWDMARIEAPFAASYGAMAGPFAAPFEAIGAYGGEGIGDVAVAGEMPVAGTTLVAGQVPILGAVRFAGDVPAGGVVTIAGKCGCGCA